MSGSLTFGIFSVRVWIVAEAHSKRLLSLLQALSLY